jgi:flavodoxin
MNTLVIYFSKFGHTQQIAQAISDELTNHGDVKLLAYDQFGEKDLRYADLIVMGTPTHRMNLPEVLRLCLDHLPRRVVRGRAVAAFDTSYKMADRNSPEWLARFTAAPKLIRKLRKLGGKQIAPPETFFVKDREGPLYEGELKRASSWALTLLEQLASIHRKAEPGVASEVARKAY